MSTILYDDSIVCLSSYSAGEHTKNNIGYQLIDKRTGQIIQITASKYIQVTQ